ncbi:MAG: CsgG/HfaB family protein [Pseudomonadota bacterium]
MSRALKRSLTAITLTASVLSLSACMGNMTKTGGSAAGSTAEPEGDIEHCDSPMGTVGILENRNDDWYRELRNKYKLSSTTPLLRLMVQQSNCFVVVERGAAMDSMEQERRLQESGEMRSGSNYGKGQMVAADYTLSPSIDFSEDTGGLSGMVGGLLSMSDDTKALGKAASGAKLKKASTTLLMVDNRSGVQLAAAQGEATGTDFSASASLFGKAAGGLGGYTKTPEGKVIASAFADSYNNMVRAVRNYQAQEVEGGLGKGGGLKVGN